MVGITDNTVINLRKIGRLDLEMHSKNFTLFIYNLRLRDSFDRDNYFNDAKEFLKL